MIALIRRVVSHKGIRLHGTDSFFSCQRNGFIRLMEVIHRMHATQVAQQETNKYPSGVANANNLRLFKTIHRHFVEFKTI